jgi:citrate synthase
VDEWLTTAEAAALLGVKPQTLYAYVSRGQLARHAGDDGHTSRFHRDDVARLAARGARRSREGRVDVQVDSALTLLDPGGRLLYRGEDVAALAGTRPFEAVAAWLWTGEWLPTNEPWTVRPEHAGTAGAIAAALPPSASPVERLRVAVPVLGARDPGRHDLSPAAVVDTGRALIAALVDALPVLGPEPDGEMTIATRLWPRLCSRAPNAGEVAVLDAALVLLADHELPASTLAARVAASMQGHPYLVVGAGLATLGGPRHGGASLLVEDLLRTLPDRDTAAAVISTRMAHLQPVPGLGHVVYKSFDPRAVRLLELMATSLDVDSVEWSVAQQVMATVARHNGPFVNIDFALGTLATTTGMIRTSAETIFTLARCAGWIAHALEEYARPSRFRMRASYIGDLSRGAGVSTASAPGIDS